MNMMQSIVSQFRQPHGFLGQVAGYIMANRRSNIERNKWTLELLNLKPDDYLLEVGFGPGIAVSLAADILQQGLVVGIDHSRTMMEQASHRNSTAIDDGRVKLILGNLSDLYAFEDRFDKAFSANVIQFWADPRDYFRQLRKLLKPGGILATTYMPRHKGATINDTRKMANDLVDCLWDTGYKNIEVKEKPLDSLTAVCVLALK